MRFSMLGMPIETSPILERLGWSWRYSGALFVTRLASSKMVLSIWPPRFRAGLTEFKVQTLIDAGFDAALGLAEVFT